MDLMVVHELTYRSKIITSSSKKRYSTFPGSGIRVERVKETTYNDAVGSSVVGRRNGTEPFLASGVPLQRQSRHQSPTVYSSAGWYNMKTLKTSGESRIDISVNSLLPTEYHIELNTTGCPLGSSLNNSDACIQICCKLPSSNLKPITVQGNCMLAWKAIHKAFQKRLRRISGHISCHFQLKEQTEECQIWKNIAVGSIPHWCSFLCTVLEHKLPGPH